MPAYVVKAILKRGIMLEVAGHESQTCAVFIKDVPPAAYKSTNNRLARLGLRTQDKTLRPANFHEAFSTTLS